MALVGNNEMARMLGMSAPAFAKGVRQGRFTPARKDKNGKPLYDVAKAKAEYNATAALANAQNRASILPDEFKGGRPRRDSDVDMDFSNGSRDTAQLYLKARAANEASKAHLQKLKFELQNGKLIEKELARKQGAELAAIMMGTIDSWASRLSSEFASMKNADEHDFNLRLTRETNLLKQEIIKKCKHPQNKT